MRLSRNRFQNRHTLYLYFGQGHKLPALENGELLDAVNVLIDEAEQHLLELTGEKITNAVVDEVFSRFCVGK